MFHTQGLNLETMLFGLRGNQNTQQECLDLLILFVELYIYSCKMKQQNVSLIGARNRITYLFKVIEGESVLKGDHKNFTKNGMISEKYLFSTYKTCPFFQCKIVLMFLNNN